MNKNEFELTFRHVCDDEGTSYDEWDIQYYWDIYLKTPSEEALLFANIEKKFNETK